MRHLLDSQHYEIPPSIWHTNQCVKSLTLNKENKLMWRQHGLQKWISSLDWPCTTSVTQSPPQPQWPQPGIHSPSGSLATSRALPSQASSTSPKPELALDSEQPSMVPAGTPSPPPLLAVNLEARAVPSAKPHATPYPGPYTKASIRLSFISRGRWGASGQDKATALPSRWVSIH